MLDSFFNGFCLPEDSAETVRSKKILVTFYFVIVSIAIVSIISKRASWVSFILMATFIPLTIIVILRWRIRKRIPDIEAAGFLLLCLVSILIFDMVRWSEMRDPLWPQVVLILDLMLVCRLPQQASIMAVWMVTIYLIVNAVERATRFGLYDITGGIKMADYRGCFSATPEEIEASPCKMEVGSVVTSTFGHLAVFLLDYYFTRGFAIGMQREKAKLQASVSLAESVVSSLVCFDLEAAASRIESEEGTPLTAILNQLLQNLHQYRPYLPDSLFERMSEERNFPTDVQPPKDFATILFTDIKSSTAIWEACPDAMKKALKMHNNIIRNCLRDFEGYEVKTIGDSFMAAFKDLRSGFLFAMTVQERLSEAAWPVEMILPEEFMRNGWRGLVVRIGLHCGEVSTEIDELSGRVDYFGRTVNRAARLEGVCVPGGVAVDSSLMSRIAVPEGWYHEMVSEVLKGIEDNPIDVSILQSLKSVSIQETGTFHSETLTCSSRSSKLSSIKSPTPLLRMDGRLSATTCMVHLPTESAFSTTFQADINLSFTRTISCLERTEGSIISVLSSFMTIGWNTARVSAAHRENGIRFISLMHSLFTHPQAVYHGIATSSVHCGTVGTRDQRFVTVFGDCVATCALLCQACCDLNTFALCSSASKGFPARPVDRWMKKGSGGEEEAFTVYEIQVTRLRSWLSCSQDYEVVDEVMTQEREWGDEYWSAFSRGDWETISTLSSPTDKVLGVVVELLRTGKSLRYSFKPVPVI